MPNAPAQLNPHNLGAKTVTRTISWMDLAIRAWGNEWASPDKGAYEFSNGRKFESTDRGSTGFYNGGAS